MRTHINIRQENTLWRKLRQCLGLLLFSLILTACGQSSDSQHGVISDNKLSVPLPKAIITRSIDGSTLIIDMVVNGDTDNPLRVKNLSVDTTAGTFSGDVSGVPTGTSTTLSLVYSIIDPVLGTVEIIRTADITVTVAANEDTPADFSSVELTYTDTDGDSISNLDELSAGTNISIANYTVGGQVEGLTGRGLILQNNGSNNLVISADGTFSFSPTAIDGDEYVVSVQTEPDSPHQICTVNNGSGTVNGAAISSISVICNTNAAPTATSIIITDSNGGNTVPGNHLDGSYMYTDAENDAEGTSTFRWLVDDVAIAEATTTRYVPVASDIGKTITFEVTPVASTGVTTGAAVSSDGIMIMENSAPFFTSGLSIPVPEDTALTGYTATATDADGDTVTFSLSGGADQEMFSIDSDSGVLSFNMVIRFKNDGNNTYMVDITATDGIYLVVRTVTITVTKAILDLSVSTADIKTVRFDWPAYVDATSYKLFVNPDGVSGFDLLQDNLSGTSTTITLPVHLTDWINARYILEAHNTSGQLATSSPVNITAIMLTSIGYVKASNTGADDEFGRAVSLSADGNTLAVGAYQEDSAATGVSSNDEADNTAGGSGAVYVFSRNGDIWEQQAYVKASNTGAGDRFGGDVSLSADGNTLAVGAYQEDSATTDVSIDGSGETNNTARSAGAVYVFSRSGNVWNQQAYVKASNTGAEDRFGSTVSLSDDGNTLAVGASGEDSVATGISTDGEGDNTASSAGAVYVFSRSDGVWNQQAYVKANNTGTGDFFGKAVSLSSDGDTLAVGAQREDSAATGVNTDGSGKNDNTAFNSGAVYVFSRSGGVWHQQAYVKASNTGAEDQFGRAVSLSAAGNTLAVGADQENSAATGVNTGSSGETDNAASDAGAVYVFSRSDGIWSQQAYVKASNTGVADLFGSAVSLSGDGNTLAVGAFREDSVADGVSTDGSGESDNSATNPGAVYVFSRSSGTWSQQAYVKASNTGWNDAFGYTMSLSGDGSMLAVGARGEGSATTGITTGGGIGEVNNSAFKAGAVYLY